MTLGKKISNVFRVRELCLLFSLVPVACTEMVVRIETSSREVKFLDQGSDVAVLKLTSSRCDEASGASYVRTTGLP